jgi:hypothetical protein
MVSRRRAFSRRRVVPGKASMEPGEPVRLAVGRGSGPQGAARPGASRGAERRSNGGTLHRRSAGAVHPRVRGADDAPSFRAGGLVGR